MPASLHSLSEPFIRRPVATALLTLGLLLIGLVAFPLLQIAPLPQIEFPTIQVSASLPGGSPETMASAVATPLENKLALIPGVTQLTSASSGGKTTITIQFDLDVDIDSAAQEVQTALTAAAGQLPSDLPNPPTFRKVNPADSAFMFILIWSDTLPLTTVSDYAANVVAQQISQLSGIAQVDLMGERKPAIRVQVDPAKLAALGMDLEDVRGVIASATLNAPKGNLEGPRQSYAIYANDQLMDPAPYNDLILAYRNGSAVRVRDIGQAVAGPEDLYTSALVNNRRGICLSISKQVGANVIESIERIKALLPSLMAAMPAAIDTQIMDRGRTIRSSVHDVEFHLVLTMVLVTFVVFLFLRNLRATLIASAVVPVSISATFAVMYLLGFSLNNISLMALTISVGFVIDDAIVMLENIYRHIEDGVPPREAAFRGAAEVGFTILSISLSLVAVFIPLLLMSGIVGRLFREFAITLTATVLLSGFVSLTFVPMACARFLRPRPPARSLAGALDRLTERAFHAVERAYALTLRGSLRVRPLVLLTLLATLWLTAHTFRAMPKGFFPQQDTGFFNVIVDAAPDISFEAMHTLIERVGAFIRDDPGVDAFQVRIGGGLNDVKNTGRFFAAAKPRAERDPLDAIMDRIRKNTAHIPGAAIHAQMSQDINIGGVRSKTQFQYALRDADLDELNAWAPRLLDELKRIPLIRDVTSNQESASPALSFEIDRQACARFGLTARDIDTALYDAFGQRQVAEFYTQVNQYQIVLEALPELQLTPASFDRIFLRSPLTRGLVPLASLAALDTSKTRPLSVNHLKLFPAVTISFNLAPGAALGQAVAAIQDARDRMSMPATLIGEFQGTAQAFQTSLDSQPWLILAAIVTIYIILGMLYESFVHPLTILSTLPSAGLGALLTLWFFGHDLGVIAIIGILLLIGIVKKNAIMVIDFAIEAERAGAPPREAVYQASVKRFRPILMTTLAAMLGGIPLALGQGDGCELRQPLGYAIVGGLVLSQLLTLFTTPAVYLFFDRFIRRNPTR